MTSLEAHPPTAYPSFCSMNLLGVLPLRVMLPPARVQLDDYYGLSRTHSISGRSTRS